MSLPKQITSFNDFLNEQFDDPMGGADPFAPQGDENASNESKPTIIEFVFISKPKNIKKYPNGEILKTYSSYKANLNKVIEWAKHNIKDDNERERFIDLLNGKNINMSSVDHKNLKKFMRHVLIGRLGEKYRDVEITYDKDNNHYVDSSYINVTLLDV